LHFTGPSQDNRYNTRVRFLIISDPHANWHALQRVLADAEGQYDQAICCGDLVGYNPQPVQVLEWVRDNCSVAIRGNHDKVVAGLEDLEWFNDVAKAAARWTMKQLSPEHQRYLQSLARGPINLEHFSIFHGSPRDEDEYIMSPHDALPGFEYAPQPLCFFGHTHLQGGFFSIRGRIGNIPQLRADETHYAFALEPDLFYLINPGSVGQPRDGDPRAAYALYDSDLRLVTLRRVEYPVEQVANEIMRASLPDVLAFRLFQGV
jgi:predicted phosphodiesterase